MSEGACPRRHSRRRRGGAEVERSGGLGVAREAVGTAYPWAPGHVVTGPDDACLEPARLHPAFHGSLDWHSCVHMLWSLLRLVDRFADALGEHERAAAVALLGERLRREHVAVESV